MFSICLQNYGKIWNTSLTNIIYQPAFLFIHTGIWYLDPGCSIVPKFMYTSTTLWRVRPILLLENGRHILLLRIVDPSYCLKMVDPSYCLRMVDRSYCLKMVDPSYCLRMVDTSCCLRMVDPSYCLRIVDTFNCLRMLSATLKWANFVFNTFLEPCPGGGYITPPYCTHGGGGVE